MNDNKKIIGLGDEEMKKMRLEEELSGIELTDEQYKDYLKEDLLSELVSNNKKEPKEETLRDLTYKEQFRQEVLEQINTEPSKSTESEEDKEKDELQ